MVDCPPHGKKMEQTMSREKLMSNEIETLLQGLDGWSLSEDGLSVNKSFKFSGFAQAFGFMAECAIRAEKIDHHPEWSNVYNKVEVRLTTHAAKGLSQLDFDLAAFMDKAASRH
jgi:4a-hydroxytetrahydrobiopterin dehydratase